MMLLAPILLVGAIALVGAGGGVEQLQSLSQVATGPAATELDALAEDADTAFMVSWLAGNSLHGELTAIAAERSALDEGNGDGGGTSAASAGGSADRAATTSDGSSGAVTAPGSTPASGSVGGTDPGAGGDGAGGVVEDAAGRVNDTVGDAKETVDRAKDAVSDKAKDVTDRAGSAIDGVRERAPRVRDLPALP